MASKKILITIIALVVFFIIAFSIIGSTSDDLVTAGNSISQANNCTARPLQEDPLFYNASNGACANSTNGSIYQAGLFNLPLKSLFSSNGVVLLVLMAALLILLIVVGLKSFKDKTK